MNNYKHKTWHEKRAAESSGDPVADALDIVIRQRKALEAENERLRKALKKVYGVARSEGWKDDIIEKCLDIARKALDDTNE